MDKLELTAKSKTQRRKQKPHGKKRKKEREKVKTLFLKEPSKCHANFAFDFSSLDYFLVFRILPDYFSLLFS